MHQSHDWELQTWVQSPVPAKFFSWDFSRFKYFERFQLDCFNGKKLFEDNRSPGTVANAVIPRLGSLALWMFGLVPRLQTLCEQKVNSDQSLMDEEILGAIYQGIKKTFDIGSDQDSTYFTMSVWPVKNPCTATGSWGLFEIVYLN